MKNIIFEVSSDFELPYWWVQSVAIEYLNCREFASRDEIWTFNFDLISREEVVEALKTKKIVVTSPITQYPTLNRDELFKNLENYFLGLNDDYDEEFIMEGPVPVDSFPEKVEFLDFYDPKLSFSEYFQVYDGERFWQWKIAESITAKGENHAKWVSSEFDLTPINDMNAELQKIRNNIIKPGKPGHKEFKLEVKNYYQKLGEVRAKILSKLWESHQKRRDIWME